MSVIKCDKCLQDIPHTHVEHLEKMKDRLQTELSDIIEEINQCKELRSKFHYKKEKVQAKVAEYQEQINEAKITKQKLEGLENSIKQYKDSLDSLKLEVLPKPAFEENITKIQERYDTERDNYLSLKQNSEDLEMCKFILGEEGIKSFIIKRLLDMLNASIQKYIISLGMTMRCKFDEYFDEQITTDTGKATTYWNFSGGERRTVDIACSWAFKDIKRKISGVSSNVEFFDEIFDAAFDPVGFDKLIEVLKERIDKHSLSCYAISHRQETLKHIDGETVNLEKENKITRRV